MCDTYSFGQASEINLQSDFTNGNALQFTDQRLRVELIEMQLQESQEREKSQIKLNEQLFKAFQESEQRLREIGDLQKQKREIQIINEQHERDITSIKDQYEKQIRNLKTELENIRGENDSLKNANDSLEDQKMITWGDAERRQQMLRQENNLMQQQIKILREEINLYKQNTEQSRLKFEEDLRTKSSKILQEEREKLEFEIRLLKQNHQQETLRLQEQNHQNEILWNKKIENANCQRLIIEKYKANDQMLYELHRDNTQQEVSKLKQQNIDSQKEIEKLKESNFEMQRKILKFQEIQIELDELRSTKRKFDALEKDFKDLESKYIEAKAENEVMKKDLQEIQFELRSSMVNQLFEKAELKKRISNERKKSLDLNNKLNETQADYSKKKSTIVKEILQQDNKIKELSKRLSQSQFLALQQSQLIQQQQVVSNNLQQLNQINVIPASPSLDKNCSMNSSLMGKTLNFNISQQTIQNTSQQNIQIPNNITYQQYSTQNNPNNLKSTQNLSSQTQQQIKSSPKSDQQQPKQQNLNNTSNYQTNPSSKQFQNTTRSSSGQGKITNKYQNKQNLTKPEFNITPIQLTSPTSSFNGQKKISFDQQTQKKETRLSSVTPSSSSLSKQRNPGVSIKRSSSRGTLNGEYYIANKSLRSNLNKNEKKIQSNSFFNINSNNPNNNSSTNCIQQAVNLLSPKSQSENQQKNNKNSANQSNSATSTSNNNNNSNNNNDGFVSQFNKSICIEGQLNNFNASFLANQSSFQPASLSQNQSLSVAEYIKANSNTQSQQQLLNSNNTLSTPFQQHQINFNNNILNDSSLGKLSFLNPVSPNVSTISQQHQEKNNQTEIQSSNPNENLEYNYNSSNFSFPAMQSNQNSFLIAPKQNNQQQNSLQSQNSHQNMILNQNNSNHNQNSYQSQTGYIIQDIQSLGTEETTQTLNTLQNSLTINQIDLLQQRFLQQFGCQDFSQNKQQQQNQFNYGEADKCLSVIENNASRRTSSFDINKEYRSLQNRSQRTSQVPSVKVELCADNSQFQNQEKSDELQSDTIISQCRILNEAECLRTSQDEENNNKIINYGTQKNQEVSDILSKLHIQNKEQQNIYQGNQQNGQKQNNNDKTVLNHNVSRYYNDDKENLNQSFVNRKNSNNLYSRYSYMGCLNDYSHLSKKKQKDSDLIAPSAATTSIMQDNDESFNLFSRQFLQSNQINPSFCSENERYSQLYNRKQSEINLNFNSESIYGVNKQIPQKIVVIDQLDDNCYSESNLSQNFLDKPSFNNSKFCNYELKNTVNIFQFNNNNNQVVDTEEINIDTNEFDGEISKNLILKNVVDKKNLSKFTQKN